MTALLTLLPLALFFALFALLVKLAAKVFKKSVLPWKHALAFSALAIAVGAAGALLKLASGVVLNPILAVVSGLSIQLALGGWYLGAKARAPSGEPMGFKGGVLAAAAAFGAIVLLGLLATAGLSLVHRGGTA